MSVAQASNVGYSILPVSLPAVANRVCHQPDCQSQQAGFVSHACFCRQKLEEEDDEEEDTEQRAQPHRSDAELDSGAGDQDSTKEHRESSPEDGNGTGLDSPQEDSKAGSDQQPGFGSKKNIQQDVRSEALDSLRARPCSHLTLVFACADVPVATLTLVFACAIAPMLTVFRCALPTASLCPAGRHPVCEAQKG